MNFLNMKIRAQSHSYLEEIFIFQARVFKFGDFLGVWKLATNAKISEQYLQNYAS